MPLVQMIITPLMFLSGALFPLSRLPGWLTVVTHLNPMTYAVEPVRSAVFDRLNIPPAARAILDPGIWWGSYQVPVWLQVCVVIAAALLLLFASVKLFNRTE
jgi:ABC-2 type transport system permease protein